MSGAIKNAVYGSDVPFSQVAKGAACIFAGAFVFLVTFWVWQAGTHDEASASQHLYLASFATFVGGFLNPLVSAAGFGGLLYTIRIQRLASNSQKTQLNKQNFEAVFFQLLAIVHRRYDRLIEAEPNDSTEVSIPRIKAFIGAIEAFKRWPSFLGSPLTFRRRLDEIVIETGINPFSYFDSVVNILEYVERATDLSSEDRTFYYGVIRDQFSGEEFILLFLLGPRKPLNDRFWRLIGAAQLFQYLMPSERETESQFMHFYLNQAGEHARSSLGDRGSAP